jgi:hypothetical protein
MPEKSGMEIVHECVKNAPAPSDTIERAKASVRDGTNAAKRKTTTAPVPGMMMGKSIDISMFIVLPFL